MSIVIEQDASQRDLSFSLHSRADLLNIRLRQSELECYVRFEDLSEALTFAVEHDPDETRVTNESLYVNTQFLLRVFTGENEQSTDHDILRVKCKFEAEYVLLHDYKPSDAEIEAFRRGNAVFNCWSFFREYAFSSVTRMGLPPPPIPFLRLVPKIEADVQKSAAKTVAKKAKGKVKRGSALSKRS